MKKIIITSLSALFAITALHAAAQSPEILASNDFKNTSDNKRIEKKEMKSERKASRKLEGYAVSERTKDSFYGDFGNMPDVTWSQVGHFDRAAFMKDGRQQFAFYDYDSKLVGTVSPKIFSDLPAKAQKELNARYKNYTVENIILFDDNEQNDTNMILYGSQFEDSDNYFVELRKDGKLAAYKVDMNGNVSFFQDIH